MPCCETTLDERSAGNLHATFCGSRRRVTASGHPVPGRETALGNPAIQRFLALPLSRLQSARECGVIDSFIPIT